MEAKDKRDQDELVNELIIEFDQLYAERGNLNSHCTEIAQRCWPSHSFLFQNSGFDQTQGEKRTFELFDSTAATGLNRFGAIVDSLLTPRNQKWHRMKPSNKILEKRRDVMEWFEIANDILFKYRYAPQANFASQNQLNFKSLGAYGTGSVFIDELKSEPGLRYKNIHLSEMFFMENHQGIIDRAIRHYQMTARQAVQQFGDKCPPQIQTAAQNTPNTKFRFLHCVRPRKDIDYSRKDFKGMKYASYYVAMEGRTLLSEGGFNTFPYSNSRYEQAPGEVYGRSPAMDVLPAMKTLNEQKKTILKQGHRVVDPVLLAFDDGVLDSFSLKPGAVNAGGVSADGRPLVQALPTGNLAIGKEMMDEERSTINDAFLVSLFQILTENPQMTATEVMERTREKGILMNPTFGRLQSEYLGPLVDREIDVLAFQGLLPPMPQILVEAKGEYRLEYDSPLSRAQRSEEAAGFMRTVESALNIAQQTQNPEPLDFFNWDVAIPQMADIQAVPLSWMRTMDEVKQIRDQRAQSNQTQQAVQAAPGASALLKATAQIQKQQAS